MRPSAPPDPAECRTAMQNEGRCHQVPRLLSPSARPAARNEVGCHQVPCLPRKAKLDAAKCHACHAKYRGGTGDQVHPRAPKCATRANLVPPATRDDSGCHQVPGLPAKRAKCAQARHQIQPSAASAMTAMQNEGGCHQVPRLLSPSARPAKRNEVGCHEVPCLPRKAKLDVSKRRACHAKLCERWCVTKLCVCVCVKRLYRRKTSMALSNLVFWYYFSFQTSRGHRCDSGFCANEDGQMSQ